MHPIPSSLLACALFAAPLHGLPPSYSIVDLGVVAEDHAGSQANGISPGGVVAGRSLGPPGGGDVAFMWTTALGLVALPPLAEPNAPFCVGVAANDAGMVVGTASIDQSGEKPVPVKWVNGKALALPLPEGESIGRALAVNSKGLAVGSVGSMHEFGALFEPGGTSVITTTIDGTFLQTAQGINDLGRIIGLGVDPQNLALSIGFVLDPNGNDFIIGALPGNNGAECLGVSNAGHIVGGSNTDGGANLPFIWSSKRGMVAIPLPRNTNQGAAFGVNSRGWAVGTAAGNTAIPFLYDGSSTHRLQDLLPPDSGWDLSNNFIAKATGISEGGVIVGTGVYQGNVRAFAMIPQPPSCLGDLNYDGKVDGQDLGILLAAWGPVARGASQDLNRDGEVDGRDLGVMLAAWGECG